MERTADIARGREASAQDLRSRLPSAPSGFIQGALDNPALGRPEVLALLLNRRARPEHIERVAQDARWRKAPEVLRRIAIHRASNPTLARRWLDHLGWKDLCEVALAPSAHPTVRRRAETLLLTRLGSLAPGEAVSLARRAPQRVIDRLIQSKDEQVLRSLLGNGRLTEAKAVRLASTATPPGFLRHLSQHAQWGCRKEVRIALVRNSKTPVPQALGLLERLGVADLKRLANDGKVPLIVRIGASRSLERRTRDAPAERRAPFL